MKTILTIAGSDSIGGAGVEADIKTATLLGVYAMTAVTAVTVQNSQGVKSMTMIPPESMCKAVITVVEDCVPDAVKVGMLPSEKHIILLSELLGKLRCEGLVSKIVVDPVMKATSGFSLSGENYDIPGCYMKHLTPIADVVTPNLPEAVAFLGHDIDSEDFCCKAPLDLIRMLGSNSLVLKGGHFGGNDAIDILVEKNIGVDEDDNRITEFRHEMVNTTNLHGTGCVLSTAIACGLAKGMSVRCAVSEAKKFLSHAIRMGVGIKRFEGNGPLYLLP